MRRFVQHLFHAQRGHKWQKSYSVSAAAEPISKYIEAQLSVRANAIPPPKKCPLALCKLFVLSEPNPSRDRWMDADFARTSGALQAKLICLVLVECVASPVELVYHLDVPKSPIWGRGGRNDSTRFEIAVVHFAESMRWRKRG